MRVLNDKTVVRETEANQPKRVCVQRIGVKPSSQATNFIVAKVLSENGRALPALVWQAAKKWLFRSLVLGSVKPNPVAEGTTSSNPSFLERSCSL